MNWIWEDSVSSITINRHIPCLETAFRIDQRSIDQLSDYIDEFRRSVWRFQEIYPGLKIIVQYKYDPSVSLNRVGPILNDLCQPLFELGKTRVAFMNSGDDRNVLPIEAFAAQIHSNFQMRHFENIDSAKSWLKEINVPGSIVTHL